MRFRRTEYFPSSFLLRAGKRAATNPHFSRRRRARNGAPVFFGPGDDRVTSYYFRATSIAPMCLVRPTARCYCADREVEVPPLRITEVDPELGGVYEKSASVLRGVRLCGGPLDFQAASCCRSRNKISVAGSSVEVFLGLGARTRCASISSARAHHFAPPLSVLPEAIVTNLASELDDSYWTTSPFFTSYSTRKGLSALRSCQPS
jgi:hypothetical protein